MIRNWGPPALNSSLRGCGGEHVITVTYGAGRFKSGNSPCIHDNEGNLLPKEGVTASNVSRRRDYEGGPGEHEASVRQDGVLIN